MEERWRVMALDYGTKRIGVAISDELRMLASARGVVENSARALNEILALTSRENIRQVLIGIPKTLNNNDSAMTREVRGFVDKLRSKLTGIDVIERDERLTSVMANSHIAGSGLPKHKRQEKSLRDEEAARIVLQEYLDETRRLG